MQEQEEDKREIPIPQIMLIFTPAVELHSSRKRSSFAMRGKRK